MPFQMHASVLSIVCSFPWLESVNTDLFGNTEEAPRVFMGVNTEAVCLQIAGEWPYS